MSEKCRLCEAETRHHQPGHVECLRRQLAQEQEKSAKLRGACEEVVRFVDKTGVMPSNVQPLRAAIAETTEGQPSQ